MSATGLDSGVPADVLPEGCNNPHPQPGDRLAFYRYSTAHRKCTSCSSDSCRERRSRLSFSLPAWRLVTKPWDFGSVGERGSCTLLRVHASALPPSSLRYTPLKIFLTPETVSDTLQHGAPRGNAHRYGEPQHPHHQGCTNIAQSLQP